jgi:hypothetical protein
LTFYGNHAIINEISVTASTNNNMIKPGQKILISTSKSQLYNEMTPVRVKVFSGIHNNIIDFHYNSLIELIRSKIYHAINFDSK